MTSPTVNPHRSALHSSTAAKAGSLLIFSLSLLMLGPACTVDASYSCISEAVETVSVDNADLGFSAQDVIDVIATGSWDLSWEVDADFLVPDFDQLNTAISLGDGDIWHRRMLDDPWASACHEGEDFLVVPLQSTLVDPGGAFVSGGPDAVYAFGLDLDLIKLDMTGPYVQPTVVPAEFTEEAEARRAAYGSESVIVSTVFIGKMDQLSFTIDDERSNPAGGGIMAAATVSPR